MKIIGKKGAVMNRDVETRTSIPPELPGCEKQQADFDRFVKYMSKSQKPSIEISKQLNL